MTTTEFLNYLHGPNAILYFNVGGITWKHKPQTYRNAEKALKYRNSLGDDICFIVNSGGTRNQDINRINAVFIDWDCGRNTDGRYFDEIAVQQKKAEFQKLLSPFRPIPSAVVETRNGFHVYWFLESGVTCDQFRIAQKRLAAHFGGDERVFNPARVMRLPGYDWIKPKSGFPRFPVLIVAGNGDRYPLADVLAAVPVLPEVSLSGSGSCSCLSDRKKPSPTPLVGRISAHSITGVINTPVTVGAYPDSAPSSPIAKDINSLKRDIDLAQWLTHQTGKTVLTGKTLCPFHPDRNPSAGIYRAKDGTWLFTCHSCGITGSIIDMAMRIWGCDTGPAISRLVGTGQPPVSNAPEALLELLDRNIKVINDLDKATAPGLWRMLNRIRGNLISALTVAKAEVAVSGQDIMGQPLFFSSLRWLFGAVRGKTTAADWPSRQNEKVDRYCLLGLLRKLPDADIPAEMLEQARKRQKDKLYRIQFYAVPEYTPAVISEAEKRAQKLMATGCSLTGISYELIDAVFGKQLAEAVYPQKARGKPRARSTFCSQVEGTVCLLIKTKGYATTADIQNTLVSNHRHKSVLARRIEKCLPAVLEKHGLVRRICDGKLKAQLGLAAKGYPKVIVPR